MLQQAVQAAICFLDAVQGKNKMSESWQRIFHSKKKEEKDLV